MKIYALKSIKKYEPRVAASRDNLKAFLLVNSYLDTNNFNFTLSNVWFSIVFHLSTVSFQFIYFFHTWIERAIICGFY
jgi:hypothetical protein